MIFAHLHCIGANRVSVEQFFHGGKLTSFTCQVLSLIKSLAEFSSIGSGVACTCKDDRFFLLEPRVCPIPAIANPALGCPPRCKPRLETHAGSTLLKQNNNPAFLLPSNTSSCMRSQRWAASLLV